MRILFLGFLVVVASEISMAETPVKFGCAYYPEVWEESRWEQDLANMKAIGLSAFRGFSCVKLWQIDNELHLNAGFDTCCCESCEKGFRFRWSA